jgi:pyridinium-3,5-biscarboxylic acid mononucleotide sulfurtransferase
VWYILEMTDSMENKLMRLEKAIERYPSAVVCYSGGVDSSLLSAVVSRVLAERFSALIVKSPLMPPREFERALGLASSRGLRLEVMKADELSLPEFRKNPEDRCYVCKMHRLTLIKEWAASRGFAAVMDGSNADDAVGHRPGRKAVQELGGVSPLEKAGFTKQDVRKLAREMGLPNWDQPSRPCLATRFRHGILLKAEDIRRVDAAEEQLEALGMREFRVRVEGDGWARIEVSDDELAALAEKENRTRLVKKFKDLGFNRILLDLEGYCSGSMDQA